MNQEKRFMGLPVSEGLVCARAEVLKKNLGDPVPNYTIRENEIPEQIERLHAAISAAVERLDDLVLRVTNQVGGVHANIFVAQKMIVMDPTLIDAAVRLISQEYINPEMACVRVLNDFESKLLEVNDEYLKGRASDIGEVRHRLLEMFMLQQGGETRAHSERSGSPLEPRLIVASELNPGDTVGYDAKTAAGFLTERGGPASHAAILSRALGIPSVSGIQGIVEIIQPGDWVLLNGRTGEVIVNPVPSTLNLYPSLRRTTVQRHQTVAPVDGFVVMANINTTEDIESALAMQAEGIGLYRTEFEFIAADKLLTENEQYDRYVDILQAMNGKPVNIRLADIGADKAARFLNLPMEDNPVLGYRGARLLLGHPELLVTQARAIVRASEVAPVNVIYPMIVDMQQFYTLREIFRQSTADLGGGTIRHGVMFEVPSACICAREILQVADFGSIGSNDLIQYLFAVDRDNDLVAYDYNPDRPAFWRLLLGMTDAAREAGVPLSFCGEMGGQPQYLPKLMELGVRSVSVSPRMIGLARITARTCLGRRGMS